VDPKDAFFSFTDTVAVPAVTKLDQPMSYSSVSPGLKGTAISFFAGAAAAFAGEDAVLPRGADCAASGTAAAIVRRTTRRFIGGLIVI